MERYEEYKDSGVEWIGKIPDGWEVKRLKYVASINDESLSDNTSYDYPIKYVDISNVKSGIGIISTENYLFGKAPSRARRVVRNGDVIVSTVRTYLKSISKIENPADNLIVSTGFAVIRPKIITSDYIGFLFYSEFLIGEIISKSTGVSYPAITSSAIGEISIPIPKVIEQQNIAAYLTKKTAEIDNLISQKEQLLKLYEEEKKGIINQAVTKGIDSYIKLKYYISKIGSGITPRGGANVYKLNGVPLLRSQNIHFDGLQLDNVVYISEDIHNSMGNSKVNAGDVLLNITGASIGRCHYVFEDLGEANVNQHVCIIRPNEKILTEFLYFILRSNLGQEQINQEQTGSGREGLNLEALKNFLIPSIGIDIQNYIVSSIKDDINSIDIKISKTKKIMVLQKEYRTALISEVVTGKVKVTEEM